ncbi:sigma-70 family RNA polymerase sigma factor [Marinococcus halophilus]|uniref:sigma-70 family RNA polymerase sigma factor n=1 Tax=Marinococcus halophilus TaxID=1371 RepID=UPI0009A65544|nr:sigma-70 family RNA polymerase sigma factor [Marinococcus halophilus]
MTSTIPASFEETYEQYTPLVKRMITRLRIYQEQEEYMQAGYVGLWKAYSTFSPEKGTFSAYAFTLVRGEMLMMLRKEVRFSERHQLFDDHQPFEQPSEIEDRFELEAYFPLLSERERTWLTDFAVHALPIRDIAAKHGVAASTVKSWRKSALRKLRAHTSELKLD